MKYAHINTYGQLLGWYDDSIHKEIPTPNIEVTEEQWLIAINNGHNKVNQDGSTEYVALLVEIVIPTSITMRQCRLELLAQGVLDQVNTLLEGNAEALIEWEYATTIERSNMLVTTIQNALNLTDEQLDEMFLSASNR